MSQALYPHLGSFESTRIHGTKTDIIATTRHLQRWRHDLTLLQEAGMTELRYPALWHRIQRTSTDWDFRWTDEPMRFLQSEGMDPIIDLVHHTSFPAWLQGGFANPRFPELFVRYVESFAERYPWVKRYTIFNEPLPTTLFCSYTGMWYPHLHSDADFVAMAINVCKAICQASAALLRRNPDIQLVHVDTCEFHTSSNVGLDSVAQFGNLRRFLFHDMILGRVDAAHPLADYLARNGFTNAHMEWFQKNATVIHVLGLDYYLHSEIEWLPKKGPAGLHDRSIPEALRGFAEIAFDYVSRYQVPIMLSETNLRGSVRDRLIWLKMMEEQCELLVSQQIDFRGFCWFPSIDSTDWRYCCTKSRCKVDPQGIWGLDSKRWNRYPSPLSEAYSLLAQGRIRSHDLPAAAFEAPLDEHNSRVYPLVKHWPNWDRSLFEKEAA